MLEHEGLFAVDLSGDGSKFFVATERISGPPPKYGKFSFDTGEGGQRTLVPEDVAKERMRTWFMQEFASSVRARRARIEILKLEEDYYNGFHWNTPQLNRQNRVVNLCYTVVETIHPLMTESRPRPEIVPATTYTSPMGEDDIRALQEYATSLMDSSSFLEAFVLNTREKLIHGSEVYLMTFDSQNRCVPVPVSLFDWYRDECATHPDYMEKYFIARPVNTEWLRDQFPDVAHEIRPDGLASPSHEVYVRRYEEHYAPDETGGEFETIVGWASKFESEDPATTSSYLVGADQQGGEAGRTTFLIQGFFRDRTRYPVTYRGDIATRVEETLPDGTTVSRFVFTPSARPYQRFEPCTPSGWRVISFTPSGALCENEQLDPAFGGMNVVVGSNMPKLGQFEGPSELTNIMPINRSYNSRRTKLDNALDWQAVPVLVADEGVQVKGNRGSVAPGDTIRKQRGSDIKWLQHTGVDAGHFTLLHLDRADLETVSGVHPAQEGDKPPGIEAAAALRELREAANARIRGKEVPQFETLKRILKIMMVATAKHASGDKLWYVNAMGQLRNINPRVVLNEFDIRFVPGSGTGVGRQAAKDETIALFQSGLLDEQTALERMGEKGVARVLERLTAKAQTQAALAASESGKNAVA